MEYVAELLTDLCLLFEANLVNLVAYLAIYKRLILCIMIIRIT